MHQFVVGDYTMYDIHTSVNWYKYWYKYVYCTQLVYCSCTNHQYYAVTIGKEIGASQVHFHHLAS